MKRISVSIFMDPKIIHFDNANEAREMTVLLKDVLSRVESDFGVQVLLRDVTLSVVGDDAESFVRFVESARTAQNKMTLDEQAVNYAYNLFRAGEEMVFEKLAQIRIEVGPRKKSVYPKTLGQQVYLKAIADYSIVFGSGPAGTGKTYLAMAMAISALLKGEVNQIILTRPAIEAGESLGFLPGDFKQKVTPYLRPLYDALHQMLPVDMIENYLERGMVEVAPLAYMRGRTMNHAFVVLDEAQNTTPQQMLMFLTRLGFDSKCVITGDPSQIDLPQGKRSGLLEAQDVLSDVDGVQFVELSEQDVVRHSLVQKVIEAYRKKRSV